MVKEIIRYHCDYCGNLAGDFRKVEHAIEHEKRCVYNPAMKGCFTCGNFDEWEHNHRSEYSCLQRGVGAYEPKRCCWCEKWIPKSKG